MKAADDIRNHHELLPLIPHARVLTGHLPDTWLLPQFCCGLAVSIMNAARLLRLKLITVEPLKLEDRFLALEHRRHAQ